jgi:hypothetical protein
MVLTVQVRTEAMSQAHESRIPCSRETRRLVKQQKRGGENYDSVLQKMVEQYDPKKAAETPERKD